MRRQDRKLAREAIGVAKDALETGRTTTMEALDLGRQATAGAMRATALAELLLERLKATPNAEVLDSAELARFAELAPNWKVRAGISNGSAVKTYERTINEAELTPDRQPGGHLAHDTYKRLADGEYCDQGLAKIFDTTYFSGDSVRSDHSYYELRFEAGEPGPLTYKDMERVLDADQYLIENGYIQAAAEAEVTSS